MQTVEDRGGDIRLEDVLHEQRDSYSQRRSSSTRVANPRGPDRKPRKRKVFWSTSETVLFL
eukprot:SAG31_NODE_36073_length_316_cov_2.820276_1_plen_60_part_10